MTVTVLTAGPRRRCRTEGSLSQMPARRVRAHLAFDAVVQVLDGEAVLVIGGQEVRAAAGELVIMPANVPRAVRAERRFKMLLTLIR